MSGFEAKGIEQMHLIEKLGLQSVRVGKQVIYSLYSLTHTNRGKLHSNPLLDLAATSTRNCNIICTTVWIGTILKIVKEVDYVNPSFDV